MPTITLSLPTAGTVITAGLHSTNYTTLQTLLNGGLDNNNILAGAGIDLSKLATTGSITADTIQTGVGGLLSVVANTGSTHTRAKTFGVAAVASAGTGTLATIGTAFYAGIVVAKAWRDSDTGNQALMIYGFRMDFYTNTITVIQAMQFGNTAVTPTLTGSGTGNANKVITYNPGATGFNTSAAGFVLYVSV